MKYFIIALYILAILLAVYELVTNKLFSEKDKKKFNKFLLVMLIVMLIFKVIEKMSEFYS